jgi:organic radical activating enzyme
MKSINEKSIITFSGGEPGLHPNLDIILAHARGYCDVVKVVTNGTAFREKFDPYVDRWHLGVVGKNYDILKIPHEKLVVQLVVTKDIDKKELKEIVGFYRYYGNFCIKLFADFREKDRQDIYNKIEYVKKSYDVETRFTGKQVNRGKACEGCEKDCVTLKALWYFPDGYSSTCPQGVGEIYDDDSWDETVEKAYSAHKI